MLTRLIAAALAVVVLAPLHPLNAQDWPARTVTMVVPFPAGGPIDVVARILAQPMSELLGQQIIIENIGGAGGTTGSSRVAKAAPDGYQFLLGNSGTHAYSQLLYKKPPYDAVDDFAPGRRVRRELEGAGDAQGFAGRHAGRVHRLRQGQPSTDAIRLGRRRLGHACDLRPAQHRDRRRGHPCALSRHRSGDAGSDGRPHRLHLRRDLDRGAAHTQQGGEGDRAALAAAQQRAAGSPDRAGAGPRGFRRRRLERVLPSQGHARADRAPPRQGDKRRAGPALGARAPRGPRPQRHRRRNAAPRNISPSSSRARSRNGRAPIKASGAASTD